MSPRFLFLARPARSARVRASGCSDGPQKLGERDRSDANESGEEGTSKKGTGQEAEDDGRKTSRQQRLMGGGVFGDK